MCLSKANTTPLAQISWWDIFTPAIICSVCKRTVSNDCTSGRKKYSWWWPHTVHKLIKVVVKGIQWERKTCRAPQKVSLFFYTVEKQKSLTFYLLHSLLFKVVRKSRYKGETVTSLPSFFSVMFAGSPCHTNTERFRALLSLNTKRSVSPLSTTYRLQGDANAKALTLQST